jgi:hypothetical protein
VPAKKRRSPQEKKHLSYTRDRRNRYGENDKSSRQSIARRKRLRHRASRHHERQLLAAALGPVGEDTAALVQERVTRPRHGERGDRWRKVPDQQLGLHVAATLKRRADTGMSAAETEQARIAKVLRNTDIYRSELNHVRWVRVRASAESAGKLQAAWCTTVVMIRDALYPLGAP